MNPIAMSSTAFIPRSVSVLCATVSAALLGACGSMDRPLRTPDVSAAILAEIPEAAPRAQTVVPAKVSEALAEPAPPVVAPPPEPRLDLLVNNAQAREVFLAIVADTRYSMLMHPDVAGTLSVTLRGVTVTEALEAIRDVYGYDFKIEGRRITVYAPTLQTRVFTLNYPTSQRQGSSELRVSSGAGLPQSSSGGTNTATAGATGKAAEPVPNRKTAGYRPPPSPTFGASSPVPCAACWAAAKAAVWSPARKPASWRCAACLKNCGRWKNSSKQRRPRWSGKSCWKLRW